MTPTYAAPFGRPLLAGLAWDLFAAGVLLRGASASPPAAATRRDSPKPRPCTRLAAGTVSGLRPRTAPAQGVGSADWKLAVRSLALWWLDPATPVVCARCSSRPCLDWCPTLTPETPRG